METEACLVGSNQQHELESRSSLELRQCHRQSPKTELAGKCPSGAHTGCTDLGSLLCTNYSALSIRQCMYRKVWAYVGSRLILCCRLDLLVRMSAGLLVDKVK